MKRKYTGSQREAINRALKDMHWKIEEGSVSEYDGKIHEPHEQPSVRWVTAKNYRKLESRFAAKEKECDLLQDAYQALIFSVASKFQSESRHETAKRYILQAEKLTGQTEEAVYTDSEEHTCNQKI